MAYVMQIQHIKLQPREASPTWNRCSPPHDHVANDANGVTPEDVSPCWFAGGDVASIYDFCGNPSGYCGSESVMSCHGALTLVQK